MAKQSCDSSRIDQAIQRLTKGIVDTECSKNIVCRTIETGLWEVNRWENIQC